MPYLLFNFGVKYLNQFRANIEDEHDSLINNFGGDKYYQKKYMTLCELVWDYNNYHLMKLKNLLMI